MDVLGCGCVQSLEKDECLEDGRSFGVPFACNDAAKFVGVNLDKGSSNWSLRQLVPFAVVVFVACEWVGGWAGALAAAVGGAKGASLSSSIRSGFPQLGHHFLGKSSLVTESTG